MASNAGFDYHSSGVDYNEDEPDVAARKKDVRRKLEARMDRKRLKEELEDYEGELDDEFDWNEDLDK